MDDGISSIRKDYSLRSFGEADAADDPFEQFLAWWNEAVSSKVEEVNAMTLATADKSGKPSARIVLLKGIKKEGFEFFTNYESDKAVQIAENPQVALVIFWKELERQIRVEGTTGKTAASISDEYFLSRPADSRIGAHASPQSRTVTSREELEQRVADTQETFEGKEITRPSFWGGYIVHPERIEFWQGRPNRLHDRIVYAKVNGAWEKKRLAP